MKIENQKSFTLVEVLVGIFLLSIVFLGIFGAYRLGLWVTGFSKAKSIATAILNEKIEELRNLDYPDVSSTSTVEERNGIDYQVQLKVFCINDPLDGTEVTSIPPDNCICDYKKVKATTTWSGKFKGKATLETIIAPRNSVEECQQPAGILDISVFDAKGEMVDSPDITVQNVNTGEEFFGQFATTGEYEFIVDPGTDVYKIEVTKSGYSLSRTYAKGEIYNGQEIANPNNECFARPQATVLNAQRTEISFCIDKLSKFLIETRESKAKHIYYVRKVGSDSNDGLTPDTAFLTIQKAASVAQAGDWVLVGAGNYQERVEIQNSGTADNYIYFVADSDGTYTGDKGEVEISGKDYGFYISNQKYIEIYGFKISNTTSSGIYISGSNSKYIKIYENVISGNSGNGIYVDSASNIEISKNEVFSNQKGIYLRNSNSSEIKGNLVYQNSSNGIEIESSGAVSLDFNKSFNNGENGIFISTNSNNCQVKNNETYSNSQNGIEVFDHASQIKVLNNKSYNNQGIGILFDNNITNASEIKSNLVYQNQKSGIVLSNNSTNNTIFNNTSFLNQENGILIEGSNNNEIKNNIIASSTLAGIKVVNSTEIEASYNDLWANSPNYEGITPGEGSISVDPLFVDAQGGDFHLSQISAGQATTSPCVDAGSDSADDLGLDNETTRTDNVPDSGIVDLGFHYSLESPPAEIPFPDPFGPNIPNVSFNLYGEKTVGETNNNKPIYKYSTSTQTDSQGKLEIDNLEWDNYYFSNFEANNQPLDLILSYPSQPPIYLAPNSTTSVLLGLEAKNTLLVKTIDASTSEPIPFSEVKIEDGGITKIEVADESGQAYFIPLAKDTYQITAKAPGYATTTDSVFVSGHVEKEIFLQKE